MTSADDEAVPEAVPDYKSVPEDEAVPGAVAVPDAVAVPEAASAVYEELPTPKTTIITITTKLPPTQIITTTTKPPFSIAGRTGPIMSR